ncbi:MAG: AAA family ATPase, partial [Armatimonadota bacterium]|nr:AAA family ATPase [Armatimonadota bacterium]
MILLHRLYAHHFKQLVDVALHLPEQGTILIEGHNEAGKSSLFEAVFFALYGQSLISERDYRLEHLRHYEAEALEVELDFSIDGRRFSVARRIGKNHTVKLIAPTEDGEMETISIRSEVNRRLQEELRLSADALLNTCFVEQKRLERLEDLNAEARKTTINELLNLRVLTDLEKEFKITREDHDHLQALKGCVGVARLDNELPTLQEAAQAAQRCLLFAQLCRLWACGEQLQAEMAAAQEQQEKIKNQRAQIAQELARCSLLNARIDAVNSVLPLRV